MDYFTAVEELKTNEDYHSPDFFRVQHTGKLALGLRDKPGAILADVVKHGTADSLELLDKAVGQGFVICGVVDGVAIYDVVDVENVSGAPYQFRSHIAMQIAFPDLYESYFQGEHVWTYSHPRMQELLPLCISCLTNRLHPSDYLGEHELQSETRKPGRPSKSQTASVKPAADTGFKAWVAACQAHKLAKSVAWAEYIDACTARNKQRAEMEAWRASEAHKLSEALKVIDVTIAAEMFNLDVAVKEAQANHARIKALAKPSRDQFV